MKSSGIGGQAVMEGVMMKNGDRYALSVRCPDGRIQVETGEYKGIVSGKKILSLPFIRGVFQFIDSMVLGIRTLMRSADLASEEETGSERGGQPEPDGQPEQDGRAQQAGQPERGGQAERDSQPEQAGKKKNSDAAAMWATVALAVVIAAAIFMALPVLAASLFRRWIHTLFGITLLEGVIRIGIFLVYVVLISRMKEIQRVFMYHGAEHKCINCIEHGNDLTVENVRGASRLHKRCGTSFLLLVMLVSLLVTVLVRVETVWLRVLSRLILLPVIAGISYEVLRLAGRSDALLVRAVSKPGLLMQKLTTREPDDQMIEVAIRSVEAVFDWKTFVGTVKEEQP